MIDLDDRRVEKVVVTSLHYLNFQSFNHWAHNYRRISLDVPNDKVWEAAIDDSYFLSKQNPNRDISFHTYNVIAWANNYGNPGFRSYDITATGLENHHFGGRVSNIFTNCNPILRNYTSLTNAVEIGIKYSEGVIMADQLLKKFGRNDYTDFFIDRNIAYKEKLREAKAKKKKTPGPLNKFLFTLSNEDYYRNINQYFIEKEKEVIDKKIESDEKTGVKTGPRNNPLFKLPYEEEKEVLEELIKGSPPSLDCYSPSDKEIGMLYSRHNLSSDFYRIEINKAIFGYSHNVFFRKYFPNLWTDILYDIKAGNRYYFEKFVEDITPTITKKDWRIQVKKGDEFIHPDGKEIYKRGQIYYRVVSLVWILREVEIMRAIWRKLKNFGIPCIPIFDKVMVAGRFEEAVKRITLETWKEHLDPKIKIFPEVIKRYDLS